MPKTPSPTTERIRLTITVTPEVHAAFQRMAEVSGLSIGRCMGDWLGDTLEGAEFITGQLAKAREAPRLVAAEMRQMLLGGVDQADQVLADLRAGKRRGAGAAVDAGSPAPQPAPALPRPVIRGGNSQEKPRRGAK